MGEIKSDLGYSKEFKSQVLKDCFETGNYSSVAKKYGIPPTTIYGLKRREKNKEKIQKSLLKRNFKLKIR
jgi:transposase-like protein